MTIAERKHRFEGPGVADAGAVIHIAVFSHGGHSQQIASQLAQLVGRAAVLETIRPRASPVPVLGSIAGFCSAVLGGAAAVEPPQPPHLSERVLVVVTPVWAGRLPPPVRSYLTVATAFYPRLAAIITHGGGGPARVLADIAAAAGKPVSLAVDFARQDRDRRFVAARLIGFEDKLYLLA
jgi:hypothetical protein